MFSLFGAPSLGACSGFLRRPVVDPYFLVNLFLVSKETVVLCRWESETKIWFYPANELIKVELPP